jgi:hypothetical protein
LGFKPQHWMIADRGLARPFFTGQITTRDDGRRLDAGWDAAFWPAIHTLIDLGLVERVGMLLDGGDDEAEIIHPCAIRGGEPAERELASAADIAARVLVTEGQLTWAEHNDYRLLVPVRKHIANVTMVEVFRLKYRPHTTATAAWYALMQQTTAQYLDHYRAIAEGRSISVASARMQYQG